MMLIFITLGLSSCTDRTEGDSVNSEGFFDLEAYIDQEMKHSTIVASVQRKIVLDGKEERASFENFDMQENLLYLKKFNINQPRWYDKYEVIKDQGKVKYISMDSTLRVVSFEYQEEDNEVQYIDVRYKTGTFISSTRKKIYWEPKKTLKIDNNNKSLWTDDSRLRIEWIFE